MALTSRLKPNYLLFINPDLKVGASQPVTRMVLAMTCNLFERNLNSFSIPQYFHHTLGALFFRKEFGYYFSILFLINNNVFWGRNKAMLNTTIPT